jgi:hypothetical protein
MDLDKIWYGGLRWKLLSELNVLLYQSTRMPTLHEARIEFYLNVSEIPTNLMTHSSEPVNLSSDYKIRIP